MIAVILASTVILVIVVWIVSRTAMSFDATELISELNAKLMAVRDTIHTTMTKMTVDG